MRMMASSQGVGIHDWCQAPMLAAVGYAPHRDDCARTAQRLPLPVDLADVFGRSGWELVGTIADDDVGVFARLEAALSDESEGCVA
jgi:hypothetical protein